MRILLTNDDSHSSPLLAFIIRELKKIAELIVVVPQHEQSWKGKSISRFGYLHQEEIEIAGHKSYTIDGTPADCVNIGLHHICADRKPDLVVSGINAGLNAGVGFIWSSGTIGACLEGNISGVPGLAFSQHFDDETFRNYLSTYLISDQILERLERQTSRILKSILPKLLEIIKGDQRPVTYSVNFPFEFTEQSRIVAAVTGYSLYGQCFRQTAGTISKPHVTRFEHHINGVHEDSNPNCDSRLLYQGNVTVSRIDIGQLGDFSSKELDLVTTVLNK